MIPVRVALLGRRQLINVPAHAIDRASRSGGARWSKHAVSGDLLLLARELASHRFLAIRVSLRCGHPHDLVLFNVRILSNQLDNLGAIINYKSCKAGVCPLGGDWHLVLEHVGLVLRHSEVQIEGLIWPVLFLRACREIDDFEDFLLLAMAPI